jgi:hypothetical protein
MKKYIFLFYAVPKNHKFSGNWVNLSMIGNNPDDCLNVLKARVDKAGYTIGDPCNFRIIEDDRDYGPIFVDDATLKELEPKNLER